MLMQVQVVWNEWDCQVTAALQHGSLQLQQLPLAAHVRYCAGMHNRTHDRVHFMYSSLGTCTLKYIQLAERS